MKRDDYEAGIQLAHVAAHEDADFDTACTATTSSQPT
jgi:hypothetical protein